MDLAPGKPLPAEPTPTGPALPHLPPTVLPVRFVVWTLHLALPLAGLWLLLETPGADVIWHHPPSHFWLVLVAAIVSVVTGGFVSSAAARHRDARLFLISLTFLSAAGFLLLHALATPEVLIATPTLGFDLAQPTGLTLASAFALAASLPLGTNTAAAVLRFGFAMRTGLVVLLAAWATVSLLRLPPLNAPARVRDVDGPLVIVALLVVAAFVVAAVRFYLLHRRNPAAMLLSIITALALLAESMVAVTLADKWHLSWWEWHLLLALAFGFVAYSAYVQYGREGSSAGLFDAVALDATARDIRAGYETALEDLVTILRDRERGASPSSLPVDGADTASRLAARFGLTEGQAAILDRAGAALAVERELSELATALVAAGEGSRVGLGEEELLRTALKQVRDAYGDVRVGLVTDGTLSVGDRWYDPAMLAKRGPHQFGDLMVRPLVLKGLIAGVLEVPAQGGSPIRVAMAEALANQLSTALENARLYGELGTLFRQYLSPDVAASLLADPAQAALGGSLIEVTALFADLRGFTTFSEQVEPGDIVTMLNRYHGVAVPCILDNGGTVVQFVGDALLALFNAPARQPDHAARAVRAALEMQRAVDEIAGGQPDWPRFRVGANTGPALVGNIGSEQLRGFNAMGDAVNVAARLQTLAEPGSVVIGDATRQAAGEGLSARLIGDLKVKGRVQPVRAYIVDSYRTVASGHTVDSDVHD
jgi:adenylate cyclase